ncbi:MAG: hypothetical protein RMI39_10300 [Thermoanaerobaculum sp.]|nr:hypothetical protein [Thermoanaerobaculum sp.]
MRKEVAFVVGMLLGAAVGAQPLGWEGGPPLQRVLCPFAPQRCAGMAEARELGQPQAPSFAPDVQALGEVRDKQFVVHWLYHSTGLAAGIGEDPVGEASITPRCSGQELTGASAAPFMYPSWWSLPNIATYYYQAPRVNDVTFYKVTWVRSPALQNVQAWFGSSDYFKLWINGSLVGSRTSGGPKPFTVDEYKYPVTLNAGYNFIVLRQTFPQLGPSNDPDPNNRTKYFSLRFVRDSSGAPLTNLVATLDPLPQCEEAGLYSMGLFTRTLIPSVAHLPGALGSQWRTDFELYNAFPWAYEWRFAYFREGNNSGTPDARKTVTLGPYDSLVVTGALRDSGFFGVPGDEKGYAWLYGLYDFWILDFQFFRAKVYNQAATGTFGMAMPFVGSNFFMASSPAFYLFNLRNGAFRTNLAVVPAPNANSEYRLRLTLFGPDFATPIVKEWPESPASKLKGFAQLNNVFAYMGVGSLNTNRGQLLVQLIDVDSNARYFFAYATVNDQGTSDPLLILPGSFPSEPPL